MKLVLFWISFFFNICCTLAKDHLVPQSIKPGDLLRYEIRPFEQKSFQIPQADLENNKKYEVRVSFLGNVGAEMVLKWRNPQDIAHHTMKNFRPLDTANLYFETNEKGEIKGADSQSISVEENKTYYNFFVFMYRNSLAKNQEFAEKPMDFYITILPVVIPGLGYNVVWAYALSILISSILLCGVLPRVIHKIPYFKEFLKRDYDPNIKIK